MRKQKTENRKQSGTCGLILFAILYLLFTSAVARAADVTINSITIPNWQYGGSTARLRIYSDTQFFPVNSSIPLVMPGQPGATTGWFKEVPCTITGANLTIPQFDVPSTTDSSVPTAQYYFVFFDSRGYQRDYFFASSLWIPPDPDPTTWLQISEFNQMKRGTPPEGYYTAAQVDRKIQDAIGSLTISDASTTVKGRVKISAAPDDAANPIAVGTNDTAYLADRKAKYIADYASLAAAVAAIGSVAPTELVIDSAQTVATNITITKNISVTFRDAGAFNPNTGITVTIENCAGLQADKTRQIFGGAGTVKCGATMPREVYPEWFGAKGDGVTDDLAAFNRITAFSPFSLSPAVSGSLNIFLTSGRRYYKSDVWEIDVPVRVFGESSDGWTAGAEILTAANKTGIRLHHVSTRTGTNANKYAIFSRFENFALTGQVSDLQTTHTVNVVGTTLTKLTGADLVDGNGYHNGNTVTISGFTYVLDGTPSSTTVMQIKKPRLYVLATVGSPYVYAADYNTFPANGEWVGQQISINGANYTITAVASASFCSTTAVRITLSANYAGASNQNVNACFSGGVGTSPGYIGDGELQGVGMSNRDARFNFAHGFDLRAQADITNMKIWTWAGNGINVDSSLLPTANPGTDPNSNYSRIEKNSLYYARGSGIYTRGVNSNQLLISNNDASANYGAGIMELSFLGNHYHANHTSFNYFGATYSQSDTGASTFVGEYSEGGQPSSRFDQYNLVLGGIHGAVFDAGANNFGLIEQQQGKTQHKSFYAKNTPASPKLAAIEFGEKGQPGTFLSFGAGEEPANTGGGGTTTNVRVPFYQMGYDQLKTGWYSLYGGGNYSSHQQNSVFAVSGALATEGANKLWLKQGFYIGDDPNRSFISNSGSGIVLLRNNGLTDFNRLQLGGVGAGFPSVKRNAANIEFRLADDSAQTGILASSLSLGGGSALTSTNQTGTGNLVLANSPSLTTPSLGVATATSINIGATTAITGFLTGTATLDFPSIAAQTGGELTVSVTSAAVGDVVQCSPNTSIEAGLMWQEYVSASGTVTIRVANFTAGAIDPASKSWKCTIVK